MTTHTTIIVTIQTETRYWCQTNQQRQATM